MNKTIKAWAVVNKEDGNFITEAVPNWGRYWIFETRKQIKDIFPFCYAGYKIVRIEIKIINPKKKI